MWTEITRVQYQRDELRYASDTRAAEWEEIAWLLPPRRRLGRPAEWELRVIVDAILYLVWPAVRGVPCRRIFRLIRRCRVISTAGATTVRGNGSMQCW
jgi:hypothetical protein